MPDDLKKIHADNGQYDGDALHLRSFRDQLQDHDMQQLMPQSHGDIEVFAAYRVGDVGILQSHAENLGTIFFGNDNINHVIIPIGPGHWRGMCLTKPTLSNPKYQLEIFDPYGPDNARLIKKGTLDLLYEFGLHKEQIEITYAGPKIPQKDDYACGDFTCAYINQKVRNLSKGSAPYKKALVETYESVGNTADALRQTSRAESERLSPRLHIEAEAPSTTAGTKKSGPTLNAQEEEVMTRRLKASPQISKKQIKQYKGFLESLLLERNSIFEKAKKADSKSYLSDEELSAKLQAKEFRLAGLKPKS
jgi:hypothetical protein